MKTESRPSTYRRQSDWVLDPTSSDSAAGLVTYLVRLRDLLESLINLNLRVGLLFVRKAIACARYFVVNLRHLIYESLRVK